MSREQIISQPRGPIAWMVHNRVTPNLLMIFLILGGLFTATRIKQEVFPEFDLDLVTVSVSYTGASPEEVEQGIILVVEEAIRGLDGVKELTATAAEGKGTVRAELEEGADRQKIYQEIQQEIDRITTFPDDADEPEVSLVTHLREVLALNLYGDVSEMALRETADQVRDRLLQNPRITQVDLSGIRDYEIMVEVPREQLRVYGLTLAEIARAIYSASIDIPGGSLDTAGGDILLRIKDRRDWADEFARIPLVTTAGGSVVYLEEIATVSEGFEDTDRFATYDGSRAIGIDVYRVGDQTPIEIASAAKTAMAEIERDLPEGIQWSIGRDASEVYQQRLELLRKNAIMGLVLVIVVLGLFLELRLAFWVTMNIPTAFIGSLLFLPAMGVSINMMSMFAFTVALGIVVDSAIVAGENIYEYQEQGMGFIKAAILGARDVAVPITFSILTNVVAFLPLLFIPGTTGKIWKVVPLVVITVFFISLVEALLILPGHLAHIKTRSTGRPAQGLHRLQQSFSRQMTRFINGVYGPFLDMCIRWRTMTVALGITILMVVICYALSGRIGFIMMPRVESDSALVTAVLPVGSPMDKIRAVEEKLSDAMRAVAAENGEEQLLKGIFAKINENQVEMRAYLTEVGVRPLNTGEVTRLWREKLGTLVGLESLRFESDRGGPGSGAALTVELTHSDIDVLDQASEDLAEALAGFSNVKDIDDGYTPGKQQIDFSIKPEGQSLGLTSAEVARQVRNAFSGAQALKQQRGRNEVTVRVRLPENERTSEYHVEHLMIHTPTGVFVPLTEIASVERNRAYTSISRRDARRTVTVSANVEPIGETGQVQAALNSTILPELIRKHPGLAYGYQGRQADMKESMQNLISGFILAIMAIYFLLAIPFRSYSQPLIVMIAIPFGIVGAVIGHLIMGYNLSVMSMMGIVALSGVVVNGSLILIDYANQQRREGVDTLEAIRISGQRRFRPIILTTLTTFGGLAPMIFETSRQARFMIPMALSLGFGILFATVITLILVPCLYMMIEDIHQLMGHGKLQEEEPDAGLYGNF